MGPRADVHLLDILKLEEALRMPSPRTDYQKQEPIQLPLAFYPWCLSRAYTSRLGKSVAKRAQEGIHPLNQST